MSRLRWIRITLGVSFSVALAFTAWVPSFVVPAAWGTTAVLLIWWVSEYRRAGLEPSRTLQPSWESLERRFSLAQEAERKHRAWARAHLMPTTQGIKRAWWVEGWTDATRKDLKVVCELAGRRLKASPFFNTLSPRTQQCPEDLGRWLYFLVEIGEGDKSTVASTSYQRGHHEVSRYDTSIERVTDSSLRACVVAAARELESS